MRSALFFPVGLKGFFPFDLKGLAVLRDGFKAPDMVMLNPESSS